MKNKKGKGGFFVENKKGWLRIVEAFISILIIASVLIIVASRQPKQDETENVHELQRAILKQVSSNETLRGNILQGKEDNTKKFIEKKLPVYLNFSIRICEINEICGMRTYVAKEIYGDEILIASNLTQYSPKKLKFFVWEK